jgi:Family of unknown function (DUF6169)
MTTHEPYNFKISGSNKYIFETETDILYSVEFTEGSYYFHRLPEYIYVFELSINILRVDENISPPYDKRVEVTVVKILSTFLSSKENAVIYICQNLDDRHYARKRKFDAWFKQNATNSLEKFDLTINYEETAYLTSLIVHENNMHKEELIGLFFDQPNQLGK